MEVIVFHLTFSCLQQLTNSELHTLVVEAIHLEHLVHSDTSVETDQEGLKDTLSALQIEVHDLHPEHEWNQWGFSHPIQISCTSCKCQRKYSDVCAYQVLTSYKEVLVVRADLLGTNEIMEEFSWLDRRKVYGVVFALEWVLVDSVSGGFVDDFLFFLDCRSEIKIILITELQFIIETLDELVVLVLKLYVVLLRNLIGCCKSELGECGV